MVSNSAYVLEEWRAKQQISLVKNPNFHDRNGVSIDRVNFYNGSFAKDDKEGKLQLVAMVRDPDEPPFPAIVKRKDNEALPDMMGRAALHAGDGASRSLCDAGLRALRRGPSARLHPAG